MKIGSLFSGIGGLDLACEQVFGGRTIWQVERDPYCQKVLAARWPDAERFDDVTTVSADVLDPVDVLCGGFPCQDLSVAGKRAGLDGERSGLYAEMLRLVAELHPRFVVFENVPALMSYRSRVDNDLQELGYGARWQICEASDVGAPHRRRRVFVLAVHGADDCTVLPRPSAQPDLFAPLWERVSSGELWPTALADGDRKTMFAQGAEPLGHAVRWPTPTVCGNYNCKGASATSGDGLATAVRWPTPCARDYKDNGDEPSANKRRSPSLPCIAVKWPTPQAQDDQHSDAGVLNPSWVDLLMGFPAGWTDLKAILGLHAWPLGRGPAQAPHEPPRLVPKKSVWNRRARLRALGNAVVPQQAVAALRRMVAL